jgi:hypothetical protein
MEALKDRRIVLALVGGALALLAGLGIAVGLMGKHADDKNLPPPAAQAGLVVEARSTNEGKLDPKAQLRCFVAGQFVGEATLADCARRNGVATGALDVGVDPAGNLAAASQAGTVLTPLPPTQGAAAAPMPTPGVPAAAAATGASIAPAGACWRYASGEWRKLPQDLGLNACAQTLFAGRCERPGGATYGRWMGETLRLVPGRIEVSNDNRSFRTLVEQGPGCAVPAVE